MANRHLQYVVFFSFLFQMILYVMQRDNWCQLLRLLEGIIHSFKAHNKSFGLVLIKTRIDKCWWKLVFRINNDNAKTAYSSAFFQMFPKCNVPPAPKIWLTFAFCETKWSPHTATLNIVQFWKINWNGWKSIMNIMLLVLEIPIFMHEHWGQVVLSCAVKKIVFEYIRNTPT